MASLSAGRQLASLIISYCGHSISLAANAQCNELVKAALDSLVLLRMKLTRKI